MNLLEEASLASLDHILVVMKTRNGKLRIFPRKFERLEDLKVSGKEKKQPP